MPAQGTHCLQSLLADVQTVRERTQWLCTHLETEDYGVQPMPDASPPKWHLAHTTWFFETFLIKRFLPSTPVFHPHFEQLFNSYYNGVGEPFPRDKRGTLSRPTVSEVMAYRAHVDEAMHALAAMSVSDEDEQSIRQIMQLGRHHEQQHQELLLTDIKYNFGHNPLYPPFVDTTALSCSHAPPQSALSFIDYDPGLVEIGAMPGFCFDNEMPRHKVYLTAFSLANRLVTNAEFQAFMEDGGYHRPELWLSEGWSQRHQQGRDHPLYWRQQDGVWFEYRLDGLYPLVANAPVVHVSGYESAAFAAWSNARLPTEFEWEFAASFEQNLGGNFAEQNLLHPQPQRDGHAQMFGDVWEWTSSHYGPYPGYQSLPGVLGEYNGKFMSSQWVLRGGSCATPQNHIRASYRNFFYPKDTWQFSGIRLARNP
ncbi:MAG: ergothioneine biosynthesis protein EgtB [OM182 bacterium]|nr:MAG: ergothioneine biosynthesis protein EgtB [OM182 bacterium]